MKTWLMKILSYLGIIPRNSDTAAVVIGVENGRYGSCPGAIADSNRMRQLLKGYTSDVTLLQNRSATKAQVAEALAKGASKDLLVVYYSGHGGQAGKGDSSEADKKDEYLCLYDGALYDNDIWKVVCQAKRTFLIFDCCHSETMYRALNAHVHELFAMSGETPNMLCWSGCPDSTYSYGSEAGGYFTNSLLHWYKSSKTYDQLWHNIASDSVLQQYQIPRKTQFGKWNNLVFR